ncbi:MAG: ABC transporter permease, partial [Anaerolineales bacterium]|nr:ABC transporter permease [Anaerolineales bacterium]
MARKNLQPSNLQPSTITIRPARGWSALNLRDLWIYRELVYFLTWRDVKVRYKQAFLGVAWAILQPLLTMVIFSVIMGYLLKVPTDNSVPYPVFSFVALLPWQLFAGALQRAGTSLVGNSNLITKVYFPRLVIPFSAVAAGLIDFCLAFLVLLALMFYYHLQITLNVLWLPLLVILALLTALAVGLWLSALNVQYRDVQHMIPFIVQAWFYASPVVYS